MCKTWKSKQIDVDVDVFSFVSLWMSRKSIKDYFNVAQLENHEPDHADDN